MQPQTTLIVTEKDEDWPWGPLPGTEIVSARNYLNAASFNGSVQVVNLCRSFAYQRIGYYVSLLAEARGHHVWPGVTTVQDLKSRSLQYAVAEDLEDAIAAAFVQHPGEELRFFVFLGRCAERKHDAIAKKLFEVFSAPCLEVKCTRDAGDPWELDSVRLASVAELPDQDMAGAIAREFFERGMKRPRKQKEKSFDLAILHEPADAEAPSNKRALQRFIKAAADAGMDATLITKEDYAELPTFDALFIRETTNVNHHTYRFARRAAADGLVVVDDPVSIFRCSNKVYLAEALKRAKVPVPDTLMVHRGNVDKVAEVLGLPCVIKLPDSAFSRGVEKVENASELEAVAKKMLGRTDILVAQRFVKSDFDWRIGVFDGKPLYACRYYMARRHWQVVMRSDDGKRVEGAHDTLAIDDVPKYVIETALRAARVIGDGLYGVDLKDDGKRALVIEVNDNPSIDAGVEDSVLKDGLYAAIMETFVRRIEQLRGLARRERGEREPRAPGGPQPVSGPPVSTSMSMSEANGLAGKT